MSLFAFVFLLVFYMSNLLRGISIIGSILSIVVGISYLIYGFTNLNYQYSDCDFFYCNTSWRGLVSFAPDVFMDTFQPTILGLIGVVYALAEGTRPAYPKFMSPPSSNVFGGFFHILMALFGNIGYMSWFGIAVAAYNILTGLAIITVCFMSNEVRTVTRPKDANEMPATAVISTLDTNDSKGAHTAVVV